MTTLSTSFHNTSAGISTGRSLFRDVVAGGMVFDTALGVWSLVGPGLFAGWLSISGTTIRATGGFFLLAAASGAVTLWRGSRDARLVAAGNVVFAIWCLSAVAFAGPKAWGTAILAASALSAAGTAAIEHRLSQS